jgi:hypothetical protein
VGGCNKGINNVVDSLGCNIETRSTDKLRGGVWICRSVVGKKTNSKFFTSFTLVLTKVVPLAPLLCQRQLVLRCAMNRDSARWLDLRVVCWVSMEPESFSPCPRLADFEVGAVV